MNRKKAVVYFSLATALVGVGAWFLMSHPAGEGEGLGLPVSGLEKEGVGGSGPAPQGEPKKKKRGEREKRKPVSQGKCSFSKSHGYSGEGMENVTEFSPKVQDFDLSQAPLSRSMVFSTYEKGWVFVSLEKRCDPTSLGEEYLIWAESKERSLRSVLCWVGPIRRG